MRIFGGGSSSADCLFGGYSYENATEYDIPISDKG